MFDVTALGEVLIDFTPAGKSEQGYPRFEQNPGGAPANVVAALAKLGKRTAFIGKVGLDAFGDQLVDTLEQIGIDTSGVMRSSQAHTTLALVHLNDEGDRSFSFCRNPGADILLEPGEIQRESLAVSKIFHFGSISMTHEPAASATREALRAAKENGLVISYDPNLRIPLWPDLEQAKERIAEGLAYADIVKLSEEELVFLTGSDDLAAGSLRIAEQFQVNLLFVTLGDKGCFYRLGSRCGRIPGFQVKPVDTTGAGDAFLAGILYGLLEREGLLLGLTEMELQQIIVFANAMGALATTRKGGIPSLPGLREVHALTDQVISVKTGGPGDSFRPRFHFTPATGWMNDPNGMVYFDGEYHLCYQYHPWSSKWGPMHWGHAVSRDLVRWEQLPTALKPDHNGYIFSGSVVVDEKDTSGLFNGGSGLVAVFTHADKYPGSDRSRQRQSIAYSTDKGRTWTKYKHNPVLEDEAVTDFRDPKVFWHPSAGRWVMVIAAGDHIRLYTSQNLIDWTLASAFGQGEGSHDGVWECPDLFELPVEGSNGHTKWVLLVSIGDRKDAPAGSRTQYFIGDFDGVRFKNDHSADTVLWADHGRDNYAGVTWSDVPASDGRRIYIGWMSNWKYANQTPTGEWRSAMTIPRSLSLRESGGRIRLIQTSVRELEGLRGEAIRMSELTVAPGGNPLEAFRGLTYEIEAEFELGTSASEFGFKLRCSDSEETVVGYDAATKELFMDRTRSGAKDFHPEFACRHGAVFEPDSSASSLKMRIYVDVSSVEVFAGDGRIVFTDLIYPSSESDKLELYVNNESVKLVSLNIYSLDSIHGDTDIRQEEDVKLHAKRIDSPLGV